MPRYCAVPRCCNSSQSGIPGLHLFSFPLEDKDRMKVWLIKIKREDFVPNSSSQICSAHFEDDCILRHFGQVKLRKDAVPTKFDFVRKTKPRPAPKRRRVDVTPACDAPPSSSDPCASDPPAEAYDSTEHLPVAKACQTDEDVISQLACEIATRDETIVALRNELALTKWTIDRFRSDPQAIMYYTGMQNIEQFTAFCTLVQCGPLSSSRKLSVQDEIFLVLTRFRLGCTQYDLSQRFLLDRSTVSRILSYWIERMYMRVKSVNLWPSRQVVDVTMPLAFVNNFPKCRVIIDCTEIEIQQPTNPTAQQQTWSNYKNANTLKALIGITPSGAISFVSGLYGGATSDKHLFRESGLMELLCDGDMALAGRGFAGHFVVDGKEVEVVTPPFLDGRSQLGHSDVLKTRSVAHHRIHVERAIGRIKTFRYFTTEIGIKMLYETEKVFYICAFLCNTGEPLVSF